MFWEVEQGESQVRDVQGRLTGRRHKNQPYGSLAVEVQAPLMYNTLKL